MNDLDLHTVRIVRAIADGGSVTAAAGALGYSQPAISQHLARAEARLGVPLVSRQGRGVRLTEAGVVLARHAVAITAAMDAASEELADLAGLRTGTVRIAAFPTASATIVPRLIAQVAASRPGIRLTYVEAEPPEAVQLLRDGAADLAITFSYPGDRGDPYVESIAGLETEALFVDSLVLVTSEERIDVTSIADLEGEEWIAGCPRCRGHLLAVCDAAGYSPSISFETDSTSAVMGLVAEGLGVAVLPRLALAGTQVPAGAFVTPAPFAGDRLVHAVTPRGSARIPSVATVIDTLRAVDGEDWGLERL